MNKINTFGEFLNEVSNTLVSGTKAGSTTSLDRKKYDLTKDVKGARIGSYHNVVLPKGTIITNLPGGVFANHVDLKKNYCTGYGAERWDSKFGVMIIQLPEVLQDIENNSKVLESEDMIHFQTFESFLNEQEDMLNEDASLVTSFMLLGQATVMLAMSMARAGVDIPSTGLSDWWTKWKKDRRVNKILDRLKDDAEIQQFFELTPKQQEGKWQKLIYTKLEKEELDLLTTISRDRVKRGKI